MAIIFLFTCLVVVAVIVIVIKDVFVDDDSTPTYVKNEHEKWGYTKDETIDKNLDDRFDADGFDKEGFDRNGYNKYGYDRCGYDKDGYDRRGYDKDGFNRKGYTKAGYDKHGYDKDGFDRDGFHKLTHSRYDKDGFDRKGFNKYGYDKNGYGYLGYDKDGYDRYGYDRNGYDKNGYDNNLIHSSYSSYSGAYAKGKTKRPSLDRSKNTLIFDVHELSVDDVASLIKSIFKHLHPQIVAVKIIHGYHNGTSIQNYLRNSLSNKKIKSVDTKNPGETIFYLKNTIR